MPYFLLRYNLSFGIFISSWFYECNSLGDFFKTLVILSAIFLPIKSPVASAVFWIDLLDQFYCICCRFFSTIKKFLTILIAQVFSKRQKSITFNIYSIFRFNSISHFYNGCIILTCKPYLNSLKFWIKCF